jgi:hypothetical protein
MLHQPLLVGQTHYFGCVDRDCVVLDIGHIQRHRFPLLIRWTTYFLSKLLYLDGAGAPFLSGLAPVRTRLRIHGNVAAVDPCLVFLVRQPNLSVGDVHCLEFLLRNFFLSSIGGYAYAVFTLVLQFYIPLAFWVVLLAV